MRIAIPRNEVLSQSRRRIRRAIPLWASIFAAVVCHNATAQPPQIVRWDIKATVIDIVDPLNLFPDVRLGDPVRGMLKYDVSVPIDAGYISSVYYEPWFDVTHMIIENPRNGTELAFETDPNGDFADVNVFNGFSDYNGPFDGIYAPNRSWRRPNLRESRPSYMCSCRDRRPFFPLPMIRLRPKVNFPRR